MKHVKCFAWFWGLIALVMYSAAFGTMKETGLESHGFGTGFLTLGVGYDAQAGMDEFTLNGEYDLGEALMAHWPVALTALGEKGEVVAEPRVIETEAAEHPEKLSSLELNAGYYRLEYYLPDEHINQGKVEWVTLKPFEPEIIKVVPNQRITTIKMVFCRNTGNKVAILDYAKFCLPKHFPVDWLPPPSKTWKLLGGVLNSDYVFPYAPNFDIELNSNDEPIVAVAESGLSVKRWDGAAWRQVGGVVGGFAEDPSLDIDASGNPVVAWADGDIYVYSTLEWHGLGTIRRRACVSNASSMAVARARRERQPSCGVARESTEHLCKTLGWCNLGATWRRNHDKWLRETFAHSRRQ
jgi:hypothetical protein